MIGRIRKTKKMSPPFGQVLVVVAAAFVVLQIFLANSLSVQGKDISFLEDRKTSLEREVGILEQKTGRISSLDSVRVLAKEKLGMVEGFDSFDYFSSIVALR